MQPLVKNLLSLVISCVAQIASAEICDSDASAVLGTQGIAELRVMRTRSLSIETMERRGLDDDSDRKATSLRREQFSQHPGKDGLIYFVRNGNYCVMHIHGRNESDFYLVGEKSFVDQLVENVQIAIQNLAFLQNRTPKRRNLEISPSQKPSEVTLDDGLARLESILLPEQLRGGKSKPTELVVLPVGTLGTVPYALLKTGQQRRPLIEQFPITVLPSVSAHTMKPRSWVGLRSSSSALIVGNPLFAHDPDYDMPQLPGAELEARAVGKLFSAANVFIGDKATVQNIRLAYEKADYLYFATHGIADPSHPIDGGFLALANGRLTAREIQDANLKARLAVLSACQTGLGGSSDAGTLGLARAFYLAGVDSVVMSLWDVDDEATGFLMQQFMENVIRMYPAQALQRAILRAKEKYPNEPHKWASFAYFGVVY